MQNRIVLISDDSDFFEYIIPKISLRKKDELYRFSFNNILEQIHLLTTSLLIINSENSEEKTLELLNITKGTPAFVFSYNQNPKFEINVYNAGALAFITLLTSDEEFSAKIASAMNIISSLEKNKFYREILVNNHLITANNEVYTDYINILESEIKKIQSYSSNAVLAAISPNDKTKFLLQPNQIETIILSNIRNNDLLMTYAPNRYFLLLLDTNVTSAQRIWEKISANIPEKIYAGFVAVGTKKREQLVNEVLNKLHEAINRDTASIKSAISSDITGSNFKLFRQEFNKKLEQVITPVFYQIQQKYNQKLFGMTIEQGFGEGYGILYIKNRFAVGELRITCPGLSKINIDIKYQAVNDCNNKQVFPQSKRIVLEPEELESGLIEDLLEQFIIEFKKEVNDGDA